MGFLDGLTDQLGSDATRAIAARLGVDNAKASNAVSSALPMLLGGLDRSARAGGGAALDGALDRDHDGSILDDVTGYLGGSAAPEDDGIVGHVFGDSRDKVESALGGLSGLDGASAARLLQMLAPLVMGALGREKRRLDLDADSLGDLLRIEGERSHANGGHGALQMLSRVLDTDDHGGVTDEISSAGRRILSSMLNRF